MKELSEKLLSIVEVAEPRLRQIDAMESATYSVKANDAISLLVCITNTISGVTAQGTADGLADGTETDCYSVNAAGTAALVSVTLTVAGTTLNFM